MKDDRIYLFHIRDAITDVFAFTAEAEATFFSDRKTQFAVVRTLEIIGEASKRLSARSQG